MMSSFVFGMFSSHTTEDQDPDTMVLSLHEGDPWEGCEDIAGEDLADFLSHQLRLKDASCPVNSPRASVPSTQCSTPRDSTPRGERPSVGSFSATSSCSDLSFSIDCLPPPSPGANIVFEPVAMEPLVEEEDCEDDSEGEHDWEVEWMLRSHLAAPTSARQLEQIELLAVEAQAPDVGDRCLALMEKCKARMPGM